LISPVGYSSTETWLGAAADLAQRLRLFGNARGQKLFAAGRAQRPINRNNLVETIVANREI
jgi:hypothetical protein